MAALSYFLSQNLYPAFLPNTGTLIKWDHFFLVRKWTLLEQLKSRLIRSMCLSWLLDKSHFEKANLQSLISDSDNSNYSRKEKNSCFSQARATHCHGHFLTYEHFKEMASHFELLFSVFGSYPIMRKPW